MDFLLASLWIFLTLHYNTVYLDYRVLGILFNFAPGQMPHLSHPIPRESIGYLVNCLFVSSHTLHCGFDHNNQPLLRSLPSDKRTAIFRESYKQQGAPTTSSSCHASSHIFRGSSSREYHQSQSFVAPTPCDPNILTQASVGLAASHCLTDVATSTYSFSDQQSPSFTVFHSILFSFFVVLLIVYNYFIYLLTFTRLLDPLTSSQASKDRSHIYACHLTNLPPALECQHNPGCSTNNCTSSQHPCFLWTENWILMKRCAHL